MMKNILIMLLVLLNSCKPVVMFIAGVHQPKPEDKESITSYLDKKNIETNNILVYDDTISLYKKMIELEGLPEIRIFNKQGVLIYYKDSANGCTGPAEEFTKSICSAGNLAVNQLKTLETELKSLVTLDNIPVSLLSEQGADYYVLIYWARYVGTLNKSKARVWENNLKQVTGCNVWVRKVNMDFQKKWYEKK